MIDIHPLRDVGGESRQAKGMKSMRLGPCRIASARFYGDAPHTQAVADSFSSRKKTWVSGGDGLRFLLGRHNVGQSIPQGSEEPVERQRGFAIVTLEVAVMQVMDVGTRGQFSVQERPLEAQVTIRGRESRVLGVKQQVNAGVRALPNGSARTLKYTRCSTGCIDRPDQGPG